MNATDRVWDLFVTGGGVNGVGIARGAAGRGLSMALAEQDDLGAATSSASSKLVHGGLRSLGYYAFGLVRSALKGREILLRAMPHISWPMRFVLSCHKGVRPRWMIRIGLFLHDHLGGREILPCPRTLDLATDPAGRPLEPAFTTAFDYSDGWGDDARRVGDLWKIEVSDTATGAVGLFRVRKLVNAAANLVGKLVSETLALPTQHGVRLVRGAHIDVPVSPSMTAPLSCKATTAGWSS